MFAASRQAPRFATTKATAPASVVFKNCSESYLQFCPYRLGVYSHKIELLNSLHHEFAAAISACKASTFGPNGF
jgi:hypothetical protein